MKSELLEVYKNNVFYDKFPDTIHSPNYGDNWGRLANYIELNNRAIAKMQYEKTQITIKNVSFAKQKEQ